MASRRSCPRAAVAAVADSARPAGGLPPPKLQKAPTGLLGAFALKVGGLNPDIFGDTVTPVVDVYDQYLAMGELQVKTNLTATQLVTSNGFDFVVPNFKVWRVISGAWYGTLNAADVALKSVISVGVKSPNSGPVANLFGTQESASGVGFRAFGMTFRPPIFLTSGWALSLGMNTNTAITISSNFFATCLIQEFDA